MSRKIKIQTVDKTKSTELENTLNENICTKTNEKELDVPDIPDIIEKTRKIINKFREEDNNPCNDNTGDAIASTNNDISIITNAHNIKRLYLIKKFKEIISDIVTDDFTDNMSLYEEFIKKSRRNGIIIEEDFQNFIDVINIEKFKTIIDVPKDIYNLTAKLHAHKEYFNRVNIITELAGYYNFLINKLFIPIENITENSYLFKLADKYISNYNKFEFNIPNENIDNFAQSASTNYKDIMSKINSIGNTFKTFRDENGVIKYGKLEDVKTILKNIPKNIDNKYYGVDNKVGELVLSIPEENTDTLNSNVNTKHYEEVNHPDHYNLYDVEVVEMMERIFGIEETMSWCKLNAFKYRMRAGEKPTSTIEKDLKKEKWCLNKYKELKSKK